MRLLALILSLLTAQYAAAETWRAVVPGDAMYNPELDMAAIVRDDGSFAVIIPNPTGPGAMAGFGMVAEGYQDRITSTLTVGRGRISTRDVAVPELIWRGNAIDGAVTYLFPISADEVELFKAGLSWRIRAGEKDTSFPLNGSRAAITAAESSRDARTLLLQSIAAD